MSVQLYILLACLTSSAHAVRVRHDNREKYYVASSDEKLTFSEALEECTLRMMVLVQVDDLNDEELLNTLDNELSNEGVGELEYWLTMEQLDRQGTYELSNYFVQQQLALKQVFSELTSFICHKFNYTPSGPETTNVACDSRRPYVCKQHEEPYQFRFLSGIRNSLTGAVDRVFTLGRWTTTLLQTIGTVTTEELGLIIPLIRNAIKNTGNVIGTNVFDMAVWSREHGYALITKIGELLDWKTEKVNEVLNIMFGAGSYPSYKGKKECPHKKKATEEETEGPTSTEQAEPVADIA